MVEAGIGYANCIPRGVMERAIMMDNVDEYERIRAYTVARYVGTVRDRHMDNIYIYIYIYNIDMFSSSKIYWDTMWAVKIRWRPITVCLRWWYHCILCVWHRLEYLQHHVRNISRYSRIEIIMTSRLDFPRGLQWWQRPASSVARSLKSRHVDLEYLDGKTGHVNLVTWVGVDLNTRPTVYIHIAVMVHIRASTPNNSLLSTPLHPVPTLQRHNIY